MRFIIAVIFFSFFRLELAYSQAKIENQRRADSVKVLIAKAKTVEEKIDLTNKMAKKYYRANPDTALHYANLALEQSKTVSYQPGIVASMSNIAKYTAQKGEYENGLGIAYNALNLADSIRDDYARKSALNALCDIFYFRRELDSLLKYEQEAVIISEKIDEGEDLLVNYNNMAVDYSMKGYYELGLKYFLKGLEITETLNKDPVRDFQLIANLCELYDVIGNTEKSLYYSQKLKDIAQSEIVNQNSRAYAEILLGQAHYARKEYVKSRSHLETGLELIQHEGVKYQELLYLGHYHLGLVNIRDGREDEAITHLKESVEWSRKSHGAQYHSEANISLAELNIKAGKLEAARDSLRATLAFAQTNGDLLLQNKAFLGLARYDSIMGNDKDYIRHYRQHITLQDSLFSLEKRKSVAQMQIEYETALKDKEIALLQKENSVKTARQEKLAQMRNGLIGGTLLLMALLGVLYNRFKLKQRSLLTINQQKEAIERKSNENERLIRETHHQVKNNLQIILSLLNAQKRLLKQEHKAISIVQESQNRIKSLSLIHEDLFKTGDYEVVKARTYMETLASNVRASFGINAKNVSMKINIDNLNFKVSRAITLGLILTELLTYSLKYSLSDVDKGLVKVFFGRQDGDDHYTFKVNDNGHSISHNVLEDELSAFGFQLVEGLTQQMSGNLCIDHSDGNTVQITLPCDNKIIAADQHST
ncbi:MAG: histidine kinase dimerization/phosphoacceptor domain -containing protein [Bacteroidota bacterium]